MTIYETIIATYPELERTKVFEDCVIYLENDSDGIGTWIREWNYSKPLPEGLVVGKPVLDA